MLDTRAAGSDLRVLLGVMSTPLNPRLRMQWREWRALFNRTGAGFDVKFVLGNEFYVPARRLRRQQQQVREPQPPELLKEEGLKASDLQFVDGRERLPHVGKVTEKSAAFWLSAVRMHPGYDFYCKADDDTLVHVDRLHAVLGEIRRSRGKDAATYIGHIKWRGWNVGHRFQACGGGWGPARKTGDDIALGGVLPGGKSYPPCPHAAGPYPYMSGGMVCMSRAMAGLLAADAAFNDFVKVAKQRNSAGVPCRVPQTCAAQPNEAHMWHHEDAGMGFNVFRAVIAANATAAIVPIPGHFNDAGIIERTRSAHDAYWSARAVFVHGIKGALQYQAVRAKWKLTRPTPYLGLRCYRCKQPGINMHHGDWQWARLPCPASIAGNACATDGAACPEQEQLCPVDPSAHFTCCGWPWIVPELRDLIVEVLRKAPERAGYPTKGLVGELRRELRRSGARARDPPGCVRDCLSLPLPSPNSIGGVLRELALRGDVVVDEAGAQEGAAQATTVRLGPATSAQDRQRLGSMPPRRRPKAKRVTDRSDSAPARRHEIAHSAEKRMSA